MEKVARQNAKGSNKSINPNPPRRLLRRQIRGGKKIKICRGVGVTKLNPPFHILYHCIQNTLIFEPSKLLKNMKRFITFYMQITVTSV